MDTFYEINPYIDCENLEMDEEINIITDKTFIVANNYENHLFLNLYLLEKYNLFPKEIPDKCVNYLHKKQYILQ